MLEGYRNLKLKVEMLELELEGINNSKDKEKVEDFEVDGLKAASWESKSSGGKEKHGDDNVFRHLFLKNEGGGREKVVIDKIKSIKYQLKFIDTLVAGLENKGVFILTKFYIEGLSIKEIHKRYCKMYDSMTLRSIERKKKEYLRELESLLDAYIKGL